MFFPVAFVALFASMTLAVPVNKPVPETVATTSAQETYQNGMGYVVVPPKKANQALLNTPANARVQNGAGSQVNSGKAFTGNADTGSTNVQGGYTLYTGGAESFPGSDNWLSFNALWNANQQILQNSCSWNNWHPNQSQDQINQIHDAILQVSADSLADPRVILAMILQESKGCVYVPTTANGVTNPGLMQSHNGVSYNEGDSFNSIKQMIIDGTQGTSSGDGLVQLINNPTSQNNWYRVFRMYNSGSIAGDGNLSNGNGATACYVSDMANRLQGWTLAASTCNL